MVVDRSTTIRPGVCLERLPSAGVDHPVLVIRGRDLTVDSGGVEMVGAPDGADPDRFAGLAILVDGGARITIRNARVGGYKVGILARNVRGPRLTGNDVGHNWLASDRRSPHEPAVDRAPISPGRPRLRAEYYEPTGFAELRVAAVKR